MKYSREYTAPTLTVDGVIFQIIDDKLNVLLIKRHNDPFKGQLALPGGYNPSGETTEQALGRILQVKAGLDTAQLSYIEQLYTFDTVDRDPRGHAVSVAYMGCGRAIELSDKAGDNPVFVEVNTIGKLCYGHHEIIDYALNRLRAKLTYTNAVRAFLPDHFTLTSLQLTYETILGHGLDKRNFRKKFLNLDLIKETGDIYREGAHRPAKLYEFKSKKLESLSRSFD